MSNLICRKDGERWWDDKQVYEDGGFFLISKGPLSVDGCRCDFCGTSLQVGEDAFLQEMMMRPELLQCSQAANYFALNDVECRVCGLPESDLFVEVLFPPADSFDGHFEYVEDIYRRVQHAWRRNSEQEVGDTLSLLIDQDDPLRNDWRILCEEKGRLFPREVL
ncbi:MAG: hypothetical protein JO279_02250 [Verrucomicrobia bacterium]|nr:hypothetical protein [Verrucomicrobiota bacterium]